MTKRPPIYGLGWLESTNDGGPGTVTFTAVIEAGTVPAALRDAIGPALGSGSRPIAAAVLESAAADIPGDDDLVDILRDMADTAVEDDAEIVLVHADGDDDHPHAVALRDLAESGRFGVAYGEAHWWPADDPATDPLPLIEAWARRWPDSLPIAHELKELFEDQWVRFHSLPGSKRYAETDDESAEILRRHNAVLADLLGRTDELMVIVGEVAATPAPGQRDLDFWTAVPWHYADPDLLFAHLYVTTEMWTPGALDDLLRLIAAGEMSGVILAPLDLAWLYHPYDGGADVILPDRPTRDALADRYPGWRSSHPSGL